MLKYIEILAAGSRINYVKIYLNIEGVEKPYIFTIYRVVILYGRPI